MTFKDEVYDLVKIKLNNEEPPRDPRGTASPLGNSRYQTPKTQVKGEPSKIAQHS